MVRRRRLSPEERQLWEQVAASATPLRPAPPPGDAPPPTAPPPDPPPAAVRVRRHGAPRPDGAAARRRARPLDLAPDPHAALAAAQPQMDRRRFERLRRGRLAPEARLDLHGMTLERAHAALTGFVLDADARELRLLLVITGKGREPDGRRLAAAPRDAAPQRAALAGGAAARRPHPAGRAGAPAPRRRRRILRLFAPPPVKTACIIDRFVPPAPRPREKRFACAGDRRLKLGSRPAASGRIRPRCAEYRIRAGRSRAPGNRTGGGVGDTPAAGGRRPDGRTT